MTRNFTVVEKCSVLHMFINAVRYKGHKIAKLSLYKCPHYPYTLLSLFLILPLNDHGLNTHIMFVDALVALTHCGSLTLTL